MKIAMFGHKRVPSREGGVEVVVEQLSRRMAALGHELRLYNRGGKALRADEAELPENVKTKTVPTIERKGLAAVSSSFFAAFAATFSDADVVHIHAEGPAAMCWLPRLMGKRVIVTVHGLDWQREKWKRGFAAKYIRLGEKMAVRYAHRIIVLSENVQRYFLDSYGRETVYIPNGVSRGETVPAERIKEGFGLEKDSYILFLGRLVPEKGVHLLIEAFKETDTDKKLVIAGGSSDTDEYVKKLHSMAEDDGRIIFTGFVQGRILQELYSNAYVYVLPSMLEGMPLSLLEAMSYGCCCLVSDIAENVEVVEDRALCFPAGELAALSNCLRELCGDARKAAAYAEVAADFICGKYDWDRVSEATLRVYKEK